MDEGRICDVGQRGLIFPLVEDEQHWPSALRAILYAVALIYIFLGVSIVADKFVESIEVITDATVERREGDTIVSKKVWNTTVANLTLMALGSSAPEILLAVVEVMMKGFRSGELGPSTIVGSAAFNLFVIIAVCVVAIPSPEVRKIKEEGVFFITGAFSVFAYAWLAFIVQVSSPDVVEIWEALLTLAFLPLLVGVSYLSDAGHLDRLGCCRGSVKIADSAQAPEPKVVPSCPKTLPPPLALPVEMATAPPECEEDEGDRPTTWRAAWAEELAGACAGPESEDGRVAPLILHALSLPWRFLIAVLVPPAAPGGGWPCFWGALLFIGLLSAAVCDFAELLGCVLELESAVVAITFVALGTSMPDLFASRSAALQDETADASIVNVTGSNSVNVFLGIGLPWSMCSIYWAIVGPTEDNVSGIFVVRGGDLSFQVVVFICAATVALFTVRLRRTKLGGELGGPFGWKLVSVFLLVSLWVFYVGLVIWKTCVGSTDLEQQFWMILRCLFVVENAVLVFAILLSAAGYFTVKSLDKSAVFHIGRDNSIQDESLQVERSSSECQRVLSFAAVAMVAKAVVRLQRGLRKRNNESNVAVTVH